MPSIKDNVVFRESTRTILGDKKAKEIRASLVLSLIQPIFEGEPEELIKEDMVKSIINEIYGPAFNETIQLYDLIRTNADLDALIAQTEKILKMLEEGVCK